MTILKIIAWVVLLVILGSLVYDKHTSSDESNSILGTLKQGFKAIKSSEDLKNDPRFVVSLLVVPVIVIICIIIILI